ncbi:hypothetical protein PIROE2DRAFT_15349 [Piromyces sp. E2]|nr:hypothetical protein PIROE2DRAFT_15349 [Piromyces sp. E2]|eukprot:OUM59182.1 hypothetical protein PIROE2DRAFT_15349 [Piromyces sp. E2]
MLSILDSENEKNETKDLNIGLTFEDVSDDDNTFNNKVNTEDSLKNDSVNFSSLMKLLDEPDSVNDTNSSLQSQDTNNLYSFSLDDNINKNNNNDKEEYTSTLKVPILKTYSSKKFKKLPIFFDDENDDSDDELKGESKNFTFYGKSKYNKDNLNINTAYSFPKRNKLDERVLNANINDFIKKEDILGKTENYNKNEEIKISNKNNKDDYSHIFDIYAKDNVENDNENIEKTQPIVEDTQVKDHIMKTIEVIKNDNDSISDITNMKSLSQIFVPTQQLDFEDTQPIDSTQIISQGEYDKSKIIGSSQLDIDIFDMKDSQNENFKFSLDDNKSEKEIHSIFLSEKTYNISEITKTVFDNDKELTQSVLDITEKYKNQTIHDNPELENINMEGDMLKEVVNDNNMIENEEIDNLNDDNDSSSDDDYDFNKKSEKSKKDEPVEDYSNVKKVLNFDEWKNEYFSTSGLKTDDMNNDMMLTIYENWKNNKLSSESNKIKEKKKKDKLNKIDIENIRKETDRLTRSINYNYNFIMIYYNNNVDFN